MKKIGIILSISSGILFGIVPLFISIVYKCGFNAFNVGLYRYLFAAPILLIVLLFSHKSLKVDKRNIVNLLIIAILGNTATSLLLNLSYGYIPIGTATTLHFMYPFFVLLICVMIYREKMNSRRIRCVAMIIIGIILFAGKLNFQNITGMIMAICSGISYAFYMVYIDKCKIMQKYDPLVISFWLTTITAVVFLLICVFTGNLKINFSGVSGLYLIVIALLSQILAVLFLQIGIKHIGSSNAAMFSLFEPITSTVVGIVFLGEKISTSGIVGGLLIILAIYTLSSSINKE